MKTLIIFDLEATCWDEYDVKKRMKSEIIEIGAVRLDKESGEIIDTFQRFVKPTLNPKLSIFCKKLTSIKQSDVDNSDDLRKVLIDFNSWLTGSDEFLMSWGQYDVTQIIRETTDKNIDIIELETKLTTKHLNMKRQFSKIYKLKHCGLSSALKYLKLDLKGTHHRGIDDSLNMARIYKETKEDFWNEIGAYDK